METAMTLSPDARPACPISLARGRPYVAIPGPSVLPDRVLAAMQRPAPNIYSGALVDLAASLWPDLRALAGTRHHVAAFICNGHGLWEATTANLFSRGDRVLVLASGRFGLSWAGHLRAMGVAVEVMDCGISAGPDWARVEAILRADKAHVIRAVMTTHVDTASSVTTDIPALRATLDRAGHPALLVTDCIASMGCDEFRMDDWGVDVAFAASQKGLMTPPGMGFVWFNPRAEAAGLKADLRTPYWAWGPRAHAEEFWQHWHGTAPTHHLYGLRAALDMIGEEGLPALWQRHATLARAVWAAFEAWGAGHPKIRLNVPDPAHRAHAVTAARIGAPDGARLRAWTEERAGVTLGIGLGMESAEDPQATGFLRLAHMGHVNAHMTLGALAVMEAGLTALDVPHGTGALEAAARVVAGAAGA
jgi:alanine-glyoxylate transaminase/serine-glyoxylate transaminase/serine-pyruvate transaminase